MCAAVVCLGRGLVCYKRYKHSLCCNLLWSRPLSSKSYYEERLSIIAAIPDDETKSPNMKVGVYLQEVEHLYWWAQDDKTALTGVGLDWNVVLELRVRAEVLREAEARWYQTRHSRAEVVKHWQAEQRRAKQLRANLLRTLRYVFHEHRDALAFLAAVAKGNSNADLIQDLNHLAVFGRENSESLKRKNIDIAPFHTAADASDGLGSLQASASVAQEGKSHARRIRDKAYTYLKEVVDKVRRAGRYVFDDNPDRYKGYISQYHRKANTKYRNSSKNSSDLSDSMQ